MRTIVLVLLCLVPLQNPGTQNPGTVIQGISVSDVDIGDGDMLMSFSVTKGRLTLAQTTGLTFTKGDGVDDAAMTFTGKLAAVNLAINKILYVVNDGASGSDKLTVVANDQGHTGSGGAKSVTKTVAITIPTVNAAPSVRLPKLDPIAEDRTVTIKGIRIIDADSGTVPLKLEVAVEHGQFRLTKTAGLTFQDGDGTLSQRMVCTGSLAALNAALATFTYVPLLNWSGTDRIGIEVDDQATGAGGPKSASAELAVVVTPVNDPPELSVPAAVVVDWGV